jgi:hypothetical protein
MKIDLMGAIYKPVRGMGSPKALFSSAAVPNGELEGMEMEKGWVEEGKTEDL